MGAGHLMIWASALYAEVVHSFSALAHFPISVWVFAVQESILLSLMVSLWIVMDTCSFLVVHSVWLCTEQSPECVSFVGCMTQRCSVGVQSVKPKIFSAFLV